MFRGMRVRILVDRLIGTGVGTMAVLAADSAQAAVFADGRVDASIAGAIALFLVLAALGLGWALRREILQRLADEERIRDFASTASDWYWETDTEHRFTFMSRRTMPVGVS